MDTCIQCFKPVKDEPGETEVIYLVRDDVFLCNWHCENERRVSARTQDEPKRMAQPHTKPA